ncbi:flagellar biosynthesis anti-sigma factor FlgM [Sphingomonas sp. CJ20]
MVDPIGNKANAVSTLRVAAVGGSAPVEAAKSVAPEGAAVESTAARLSGDMASAPPVDSERVARIRKAIQDGRFPILPSTVADRLLALKMEWNPNDKA